MYAALPLLLYLNASIVGPLLAPLLDAQDGTTGQPFAAQDIGILCSHVLMWSLLIRIEGPAYPNATGATWRSNLDVERELLMLGARCTSMTLL